MRAKYFYILNTFVCLVNIVLMFFVYSNSAQANEVIGSVSTTFKLIGANDKIEVDVFDDPSVQGVSCYVSRAKTGGVSGSLGMAEDTSDASVACRQIGDISFSNKVKKQDSVFTESTSMLFKKMRVIRLVDVKRNTLVYMVYSDKLIDGSPKNSVSAVPVPSSIKIPLQ